MNFSQALEGLKNGQRMFRDGWDGNGMYVGLQTPDANSKMGLPYLFMSVVGGKLVPWLASQTDILAKDWQNHDGNEGRTAPQTEATDVGQTGESSDGEADETKE